MTRDSSSPALAVRLRRAGARELVQLILDHGREFTVKEVRQVLLNPHADTNALEELAALRQLTSTYEVRAALCRHRRTPEVIAMRHVPGLFWRDLMEVAADLRLSPKVRRQAERYLIQRLPRLAVGERVALARRASSELVARLRIDPHLDVLEALLGNRRLTESELLPLLSHPETRPRALALVAEHGVWGNRTEVGRALARNPMTPFSALFRILPRLPVADLEVIAGQESHSTVVRNRAEELLADRRPQASLALVEEEAVILPPISTTESEKGSEGKGLIEHNEDVGPIDPPPSDQ